MANNRVKKEVRDVKTDRIEPEQIKVDHANAPLLTVKFLEGILKELQTITKRLEESDG